MIPKAIREELALKEGQRVLIRVEDGRIVVETFALGSLPSAGKGFRRALRGGKG